jgi:hypothetical protein
MARRFPRAWAHLRRWEPELRNRESDAFDDETWYRFGRNQSIEKQDIAKLIVPRLVQHIKSSFDLHGQYCLDNVDVGGILSSTQTDPDYLLATLNAPVCDYVFRVISKPFQNDYRSANKQFIAPLPVPNALAEARAEIAVCARRLQERWTHRRHLLRGADERLSVLARARHPARWLWPDLPTLPQIAEQAPSGLRVATDRRKWADERLDEMEAARVEALQAALDGGGRREARFAGGELRLYFNGAVVLHKIYLDDTAGPLAEAYWRWLRLSGPSREAKQFAAELRRPPVSAATPATAQFIERVAALAVEVDAIAAEERALNETLYDLYRLAPDERNLVENDPSRRNLLPAGA